MNSIFSDMFIRTYVEMGIDLIDISFPYIYFSYEGVKILFFAQ